MWYEVFFFFKKPKHCNFYSTKRELILVWRKRIKRELILETREEMFGGTNSIQAKIGKESLVLFAKTWVTSYNITLSLNMREGMTHRWIKGPLELRGEWGGVEGSMVELAKNSLILGQLYSTPLSLSLNPNGP